MGLKLVTGGAGFIGSHIARTLVKKGEPVRVLDNFVEGKRENLKDIARSVDLIEGDIRDPKCLRKVLQGVDVIFHQAALRSVPKSFQNPAETNDVNVSGTLTLLLASAEQKVRRVVFASSSSVYGNTDRFPQKEDDPAGPISPYAVSKLAGEFYCGLFSHEYGVETVSLRYFNVFGPYQDPASEYAAVIPKFILKILREESPTVDGDGLQSRDFTYVEDVARANVEAAEAAGISGQVFNVACGQSHSILDILETANRILGKKVKPVFGPPRKGDVRRTFADVSKARKAFGYTAGFSFEQGIEKTVDWFSSLTKARI